ncbi:response regulator [Paenibacillus sp. P26]|nr:response regulator [Paenibacillus sp. P26]
MLLADDESLDLEGMKAFIPWEELGLEVVEAVTSGFAAIKVLESKQIDILVTDVNMPNMSGIELARKALEKSKDTRVIFVSGYQDFHYVKQALTLNACDYVLKPMDDAELIGSLTKVRGELDRERERRQQEQAFRQMVPMVKNELLLRLFEGSCGPDELDLLRRQHGLDSTRWPARAVVLEIDDLPGKEPEESEGRRRELGECMDLLASACALRGVRQICRLSNRRLALIYEQVAVERARDDFREIKDGLSFSLTAGIGGTAGTPDRLSDSYLQALKALDFKMFKGKGHIIEYEDLDGTQIENTNSLNIQLDALFTAMTNYDLVLVYDELDVLFQLAGSMNSKVSVHHFAFYIVMRLYDYLRTLNEDLFQLLGLDLNSLGIVHEFETIAELKAWLRRRIFELSELLYRKGQQKNRKLIGEMIEYVQERLQENVTLREVAEHFSFSPNYLGTLFKEETGRNFSEFVIMLRMNKACELLSQTKLKIYEVADRVGYRYLPYFSRQFRETFGMTPLEYRRKL